MNPPGRSETENSGQKSSGILPVLEPFDAHNQRLRAQVGPEDWQNPTPAGRYNLVVIGGGVAGLVTAAGAAGLGARVALVERSLLGGDCLNSGCVPSKALIRAARAVAAVRSAQDFGVRNPGPIDVDFAAVMERMRRLRADLSPHDSARRFRDLGVDVYFGQARFVSSDSVDVDGCRLKFVRAVIATGGRAAVPEIPGLNQARYLTNETVFSLTKLPRRLGVLGAGPIGSELAQCFSRFGAEVHLVRGDSGFLPKEDRDAAALVEAALRRDGVRMWDGARTLQIETTATGIALRLPQGPNESAATVEVDELLIATGRTPNVERLNLEGVGVEYDRRGVRVDDFLRTTHPRIFACGDVCSTHQFTHAADFQARLVIQNALFKGRARARRLLIPRCTYTSPELAHVGKSPSEAEEAGLPIQSFVQPLERVDRAILDGETEGFAKVHVRAGSDRIVGATIVGAQAGEWISLMTLAIQGKLGLKAFASTIFPYPTQAELVRKLGDQHARTRLTPGVKRFLETWLRWQR